MLSHLKQLLTVGLLASLATPLAAQTSALVDFDSGAEGWSLNGLDTVLPSGGNPGAHIRYPNPIDTFGLSARNSTNPDFLGDYTAKGEVELSIDYKVEFISFFGSPVPRELVVILYDDDGFGGSDPGFVWSSLGVLDGNGMDWTNFSVELTDVDGAALPAGWNGGGAEDPMTFEPVLPAGRTWTNVLQGIDRIEFTTFVPGFFFGFTNFDLLIDNVSIQSLSANAWSDQGDALAGVNGDPLLVGTGPLVDPDFNFLTLSNAAPSAPMAYFAGLSNVSAPFKGGTLVPALDVTVFTTSSAAGGFVLPFRTPAGLPSGFEIWAQCALQDAAAPNGVALSNAVLGVTP